MFVAGMIPGVIGTGLPFAFLTACFLGQGGDAKEQFLKVQILTRLMDQVKRAHVESRD